MDRAHAIETTPLIPHHHNNHNNNILDLDAAKESASDCEKPNEDDNNNEDKSHLNIFLTALCAALFSYVLFLLLYPLILRLLLYLFSIFWASERKGVDDGGDGDGDYGVNPVGFGIVVFFG